MVSALLGSAGAFLLIGPAHSLIDRRTSFTAWLLVSAALLDLLLGARLSPAAPLAPWASALVLVSLAWNKYTGSNPESGRFSAGPLEPHMVENRDREWIQGLSKIQGAVALFENQHRLLANPAWEVLFSNADDEHRLLTPLLAQAELQGSVSGEKLELPVPPWAETGISEPLDGTVSIYPLGRGGNGSESSTSARWLVAIPSQQAQHLALFTRHTAHNFNNMLSAIVGGAGMAMDMVPEDSEIFRELVEVENMAMRAADLTGDLQQAAREVAPPDAPTPAPGPSREPA